MRYLRGTINYVIEYNEFLIVLEGYDNANCIYDSDKSKFSIGYVFTPGVVQLHEDQPSKQLLQDRQ